MLERGDNEKFDVNDLPVLFSEQKYLVCLEGNNLPRNG